MRVVNALRKLRRDRPWLALGIALGILVLALYVRFLLGETMKAVPFITLFPAILLAALIGGLRIGVVVTILSSLAAWYWFIPPTNSFEVVWPDGALSLVFFAVIAGIQLYVIRTLNLAVDQLSMERDQNAIMFQELQHRVANNLQFVSSLLKFQRQTAASDPANSAKALDTAQNRLELMARIHRRLYDPSAVNMPLGQYFEGLCDEILAASDAKNVVCVVEVPPIKLDIRRLVTLSLLMNEVITNSVKHGFRDRERGTVFIRLDEGAANRYALTIKDDGHGLPTSTNRSSGLGFRIMENLAAQLRGEIEFVSESGLSTRVIFPAA